MNVYNSILIDNRDNVVTALTSVKKGEILTARGLEYKIIANENIKEGHKVAVKDIPKGFGIIKYGKIIGITLYDINTGDLVHIHNIRSNRGKELRKERKYA